MARPPGIACASRSLGAVPLPTREIRNRSSYRRTGPLHSIQRVSLDARYDLPRLYSGADARTRLPSSFAAGSRPAADAVRLAAVAIEVQRRQAAGVPRHESLDLAGERIDQWPHLTANDHLPHSKLNRQARSQPREQPKRNPHWPRLADPGHQASQTRPSSSGPPAPSGSTPRQAGRAGDQGAATP
jgi:hypothetical protein